MLCTAWLSQPGCCPGGVFSPTSRGQCTEAAPQEWLWVLPSNVGIGVLGELGSSPKCLLWPDCLMSSGSICRPGCWQPQLTQGNEGPKVWSRVSSPWPGSWQHLLQQVSPGFEWGLGSEWRPLLQIRQVEASGTFQCPDRASPTVSAPDVEAGRSMRSQTLSWGRRHEMEMTTKVRELPGLT